MVQRYAAENGSIKITVDAGVCGFECSITTCMTSRHEVEIKPVKSECQKVQSLSMYLTRMDYAQVLAPIDKNPVYIAAIRSGLHPSCPVPPAIIKACEVTLDLAVPRNVCIYFDNLKRQSDL